MKGFFIFEYRGEKDDSTTLTRERVSFHEAYDSYRSKIRVLATKRFKFDGLV